MFTVVETPVFQRNVEKLFSEAEREALIAYLARHPFAGDPIPDTGGVRKLRYAVQGKGKRGGARVIYYVVDDDTPLYALLVYGKNRRDDLTPDQKRAVRSFAAAIKAARRRR